MPGRATSLTTTGSRPLRSSLPRPCRPRLARARRRSRPAVCPARRRCGEPGEDVFGRLELERERVGRRVLLDLAGARPRPGRKSATAAAITRTSAGRTPRAAARSCAAVSDLDVPSTPGGRASATLAATTRDGGAAARRRVGDREAHPPRRAVADVAHGVDRLARPARGHEDAQAVEVAAGATSAASTAASSSAGSGSRPTPDSPSEPSGPTPGSSTVAPRARRRARFVLRRRVLVHRVVHRRRDEERAARRRAPPWSAGRRPGRRRAWRACSPVAGATRRTSAFATSSRCASGSWRAAVTGEGAARRVALPLVVQHGSAGDAREGGRRRRSAARPRSGSRAPRARPSSRGARTPAPCRPRCPP